jgi:hypothetical protein
MWVSGIKPDLHAETVTEENAGKSVLLSIRPVDSRHVPGQFRGVNKKPHKIEEPKAPYAAKKPAKAEPARKADEARQIRYIDTETARKLTKDILDKHHDLFRKLAQ